MDTLTAFVYCPLCAHQYKNNRSNLKCPHCGHTYFPNPKPCTAVILRNDSGEFLLVERADPPKKGWWDLPGGFVEDKETLEAGANREIHEELGVDIRKLDYLGSFYDTYEYQKVRYGTVCAVFAGTLPQSATLRPADDVASYKLFQAGDIPFDKIAFPSLAQALRDIIKRPVMP